MSTIKVKDMCPAFVTNADAIALDMAVRKALNENLPITLDLHGVNSITSSFFNSSFGGWYEDYDESLLRDKVIITNYTPRLAESLRNYIKNCKKLTHK